MKLYKLTKHICNARDFGPVKQITKQPLKGRAKSGGSRIGQMEIKNNLSPRSSNRSIKILSNSGKLLTSKVEDNPERSLIKFAA
jgi:hypothetical protein